MHRPGFKVIVGCTKQVKVRTHGQGDRDRIPSDGGTYVAPLPLRHFTVPMAVFFLHLHVWTKAPKRPAKVNIVKHDEQRRSPNPSPIAKPCFCTNDEEQHSTHSTLRVWSPHHAPVQWSHEQQSLPNLLLSTDTILCLLSMLASHRESIDEASAVPART